MIKSLAKSSEISTAYFIDNEFGQPKSNEEELLLKAFHHLNEEGQEKLLDYADDLVQSGKYIKRNSAQAI